MKRYACALAALLLSTVAVMPAQTVEERQTDAGPFGRIRAAPAMDALLRAGYARSSTLRQLADDVARSGWLVFVQSGRCPEKTAVACLLHFVGRFDGAPYLRVVVNRRHRHPDNVIASVAHELQHAREVVMASGISDAAGIRDLFQQIGTVSVRRAETTTYETAAALAAGDAVWRELLRAPQAPPD